METPSMVCKCGGALPYATAALLLTQFPGQLPQCAITLFAGPGNTSCARCNDSTNLHLPHIVWGSEAAVVYIPSADPEAKGMHEARERLGLERPLFVGGMIIYVAPLWPVPICTIQKVVGELIESWLKSPAQSLAVHLARLRRQHIAAGVPHLSARALAVFGDGL